MLGSKHSPLLNNSIVSFIISKQLEEVPKIHAFWNIF